MNQDRVVQMFKKEIKQLKQGSETIIAITHRQWLGVKYATQELFQYVIEIEELNNYQQVIEIGNTILSCGVKKLLFSGFGAGWNTLCSYLKERAPTMKIIIFWHGNTTHMYEEYSWVRHYEIMQLAKDKHIDQIAFAKASMCKAYEKIGIDVIHLRNFVRKWGAFPYVDEGETIDINESIRIGIYASGNVREKNAYTQIAAASLFNNATIRLVPNDRKIEIFAEMLGVKLVKPSVQMSRGDLQMEMAKNTINFYVTLTECAPLLPLESLNNGVICIMGNNNHYFEGHELKKWLVVSQIDNIEAIFQKATVALQNKGRILKLYQEWYEINRCLVEETLSKL